MFMNGVSSRSCGGSNVATGTPVAGSSAYPGAASVAPSIRTIERTVAPTTAAIASTGQRSFWKYVSTPTASPRIAAAMKYRTGSNPAPAYCGLFRRKNVMSPAKNRQNAKLYPNRVRPRSTAVPRPSQPAVQTAPVRYQTR